MKPLGRVVFASVLAMLLAGCSVSPETIRRTPAREIREIDASKSEVAACIAGKLKETSYEVRTTADSVILRFGELTMRVFDLEESKHGTMITMYVGSAFHVAQSSRMIDECQDQLEKSK